MSFVTQSGQYVPYYQQYPHAVHQYYTHRIAYDALQNICTENYTTRVLYTSHESRMRCFVESVVDSSVFDEYKKKDKNKNTAYRFKNCAILKVGIKQECSNATIELIYSGQIDAANMREGLYFIVPGETKSSDRDRSFKKATIKCSKLGIDPNKVNRSYDIYIMRHGESEHNLQSYLTAPVDGDEGIEKFIKNNKLDTELTANGIKQSRVAAKFLVDYITKDKSIDYVFCSVLKRTRQTAVAVLKAMKSTRKSSVDTVSDMIIAPCSRETEYGDVAGCFKKDPDPDHFDNNMHYTPLRFNQPECQYLKDASKLASECKELSNITINYSYYRKYHKGDRCDGLPIDKIKHVVDIVEEIEKNNKSTTCQTDLYVAGTPTTFVYPAVIGVPVQMQAEYLMQI